MDGSYEIIKVMNNNVILAMDLSSKQECILIGKGLGFGNSTGKRLTFNPGQIESRYVASDKTTRNQYMELISTLDAKVVGLCAEIISSAEHLLGPLSPTVHVVLTDHIGFAIERIRGGMEIHNPFLYEIELLYPEEYKVAAKGIGYISDQLGLAIPDDEIGFVALHLHAARQNEAVKDAMRHTRLLKELVTIIENEMGDVKAFKTSQLTYQRLINHLRGVIDRVTHDRTVDNPLLESMKKEFKTAFEVALLLKRHMEKNYGLLVPESELGYMALHIERIRRMQ